MVFYIGLKKILTNPHMINFVRMELTRLALKYWQHPILLSYSHSKGEDKI